MNEQVGRKLQKARVAAGFSLRGLANATDIHYTQLWAFEHGRTLPGFAQLRQLCKVLHLDPNNLVLGRYT